MELIRKASSQDLAAVNRLLEQVLRIHHNGRPDLFRGEGKKYTDAALEAIFANPETPVFVYERDSEVLGYAFCALTFQNSGSLQPLTSLYIDDICVDEKARGQGIGTKLFGYVRKFAREQGCHNITLHVWECNHPALKFYEAMGMQPQFTSMEIIL